MGSLILTYSYLIPYHEGEGYDDEDAGTDVKTVDGGVEVSVAAPCVVAVYDVAGRKVAEAVVNRTHRFALQCGVYVVEGVKVVVK